MRSVSLSSQRFESSIRSASLVQRAFPPGGGSGRGLARISSSTESKEDSDVEHPTLPDSGHAVHAIGDNVAALSPSAPVLLADSSARTSGTTLDDESASQKSGKKTTAARITAMLTALPLSKLKIVVGET